MGWVRLDDGFTEHPKLADAGPLGIAMQVAALCYCNRNLTDGFIPRNIAPKLLNLDGLAMNMWDGEMFGGGEDARWELIVEKLVEVGAWIDVDGGWQIHDYLDYQNSKEKVKGERDRAADRMRKARDQRSEDVRPNFAGSSPNPIPIPIPKEEDPPVVPQGGTPNLGKARNRKERDLVDKWLLVALPILGELSEARRRTKPASRPIRPNYTSLAEICARLEDGRAIEECLAVIDACEEECKRKSESFEWFNAISPFRTDNFERKLAAAPVRSRSAGDDGYALPPEPMSDDIDPTGEILAIPEGMSLTAFIEQKANEGKA